MKIKSTLDKSIDISGLRSCGNTTRQIDFAIQELFKGNIVIVKGHYCNGSRIIENDHLMNKIIQRMSLEHSNNEVFGRQIDKTPIICLNKQALDLSLDMIKQGNY